MTTRCESWVKKKKLLASVLFEGLRQCQRNYRPGNLFTSPIAIPSWPVYRAVDGQEEKKEKKKSFLYNEGMSL